MSDILRSVRDEAERQGRSLEGLSFPQIIRLGAGASRETAAYLLEAGHRKVALVADDRTYAAAGRDLEKQLTAAGLTASTTLIKPNEIGDVAADEASIVQLLLDLQRTGATVCVAAGSGTVHDIVRYAAYSWHVPFVSVPTAASVDGFTSKGAPLIIRGEKITVPAIGPDALFADTEILTRAPAAMAAAGFGDMLGKFTSLFDWSFGRQVANEPDDPLTESLTERALLACAAHADEIGRGTEEGLAVLMTALIESGLAMLILGQSHSASGAEHHLSHYWEMEFIRGRRRQLLHGAKVGVACSVVSGLYKRIAEEGLPAVPANSPLRDAWRIAESGWSDIRERIRRLPGEEQIRELLRTVHGPDTIQALGIDAGLRDRALREADLVRPGRTTLLRLYNSAFR
ncbi:sn-glycerol-1-phosphate dehydrogenase [Cohnella zeiphila]|uniref:sn-glycerol-1-phosphate dehydrogenase n=1 Tax=Cohnella zeiphila TaxID=2761120 RepID=A0A7X0SRD5_9BACL|nr:sn-glycerol-1-phosphate dehydrogenase [Cohnella zeiphila]MBB6732483.1 sn-glycerol-1-phosphate dehydrogenase [Cohnella zeiphila]